MRRQFFALEIFCTYLRMVDVDESFDKNALMDKAIVDADKFLNKLKDTAPKRKKDRWSGSFNLPTASPEVKAFAAHTQNIASTGPNNQIPCAVCGMTQGYHSAGCGEMARANQKADG